MKPICLGDEVMKKERKTQTHTQIHSEGFTDSKLSPTQVGCPILSGPPDSRIQNSPQHKWVVLSYQVLQIHGLKTLPNTSGLSYLIRSSRFTDSKLSSNTSGLSYLIRSSRFTDSKLSPTQVGCSILSGPPDSRIQNSPQHKWIVLSYQVLQIHELKTLPNTSGLSYLIRSSRFTDSNLSPTQVGCPILSGPPDSRTQTSPQHKWVVLSYQVLQIHELKTLPNTSGLSYLIRSSRFTDLKLSPTQVGCPILSGPLDSRTQNSPQHKWVVLSY